MIKGSQYCRCGLQETIRTLAGPQPRPDCIWLTLKKTLSPACAQQTYLHNGNRPPHLPLPVPMTYLHDVGVAQAKRDAPPTPPTVL